MFAGIGGFRTGLTNAGDFFMPVGWCEKDKHAQKAYRLLYGTEGEYFCDDARIINPADLPDFDLICGGFPCQPFSVAGQRLGFADERGTLFHEICALREQSYWHEARHPISNRKGEHSGVLITSARAILTPERLKVRQCGRRFKGPDEPMYALTTQDVHGVILLNGIIRRLMPIECFRLQGFADSQFQILADNGISDSRLYKMAGNSVTTNVVTAIAEKLAWEINQLPNETEETT